MADANLNKAVVAVKKAAKLLPNDPDVFNLMGNIARCSNNEPLELEALKILEKIG